MALRLKNDSELRRLTKQATPAPQKPVGKGKGRKAGKGSEKVFQKSVCDLLDRCGILYTVSDSSRIFGPDGKPRRSKVRKSWPDLTGVLPPNGRLLVIEVKATERLRYKPGQKEMHERLRAVGALVIVPWGEIEEVARRLKSSGFEHPMIGALLTERLK